MEDDAQLVIDEGLYLQAVKTLSEIEDRGKKFELLNVISEYTDDGYLAAHFENLTGDSLEVAVKHAVSVYVTAIYLVDHDHASLGDIGEIRNEYAGETLDFIRAAAWAFINAWTHRYGGFWQQRVVGGRGTFIDPSLA